MTEPHEPEKDAVYLYNSYKHLPVNQQLEMAETTLKFLDSLSAAVQYPASDLVYMKGVWNRVLGKINVRLARQRESLASL